MNKTERHLRDNPPAKSADMELFEKTVFPEPTLMLNLAVDPRLWHAHIDHIRKYDENPYEHPYTKGAWEGWKAHRRLGDVA